MNPSLALSGLALCAHGTALWNPLPPLTLCVIGMLRSRRPKLPLQSKVVKEIELAPIAAAEIFATYLALFANTHGEREVMFPVGEFQEQEGVFHRVNLETGAQRHITTSVAGQPTCVLHLPLFGANEGPEASPKHDLTLLVVASWHRHRMWLMNADTGEVLCDIAVNNPCDVCLVPLPLTEDPIRVPAEFTRPNEDSVDSLYIRHLIAVSVSDGIAIVRPFPPSKVAFIPFDEQQPGLTYVPRRHCLVAIGYSTFVIDLSAFLATGGGDTFPTWRTATEENNRNLFAAGLTWINDDTVIATPYGWSANPFTIDIGSSPNFGRDATKTLSHFVPVPLQCDAAGMCVDGQGHLVMLHKSKRRLIIFQ